MAWTGLILSKRQRDRPAQAWQVFTCARHADGLTARRRLLPRDWELLARWQAEARRCRPGHPRRPTREDPWVPPRPLAEGDAAHELFDRARQWAMTHPDQ